MKEMLAFQNARTGASTRSLRAPASTPNLAELVKCTMAFFFMVS